MSGPGIDRFGVPAPRPFETMGLVGKLKMALLFHPSRTVRCPQYKVPPGAPELTVVCPCVFAKGMAAAQSDEVSLEMPPLEPLALRRYTTMEGHDDSFIVYAGECPACRRIVYMPLGALSDKERSNG